MWNVFNKRGYFPANDNYVVIIIDPWIPTLQDAVQETNSCINLSVILHQMGLVSSVSFVNKCSGLFSNHDSSLIYARSAVRHQKYLQWITLSYCIRGWTAWWRSGWNGGCISGFIYLFLFYFLVSSLISLFH